MSASELSRRAVIKAGLAAAALPALGVACSSGSSSSTSTTAVPPTTADPMADLLDAAREDGELNLIAISDSDQSAYKPLLEGFRSYSGLDVHLDLPQAGSGIEIDAVRDRAGQPDQPDVIDVGMTHAVQAAADGLLVQSIRGEWVDIPSAAKDSHGLWLSNYYGMVGIASNPALLEGADPPASPEDLRNLPEGVTMAFPGDPRTTADAGALASAVAFAAVWCVGLAVGGTFDDIGPGIDFFAELADEGIFDPGALGITGTLAGGDVAVTMLNNFELAEAAALMRTSSAEAEPAFEIIEADLVFPSYYAQCAVKDSPHPDAAQLWLAYLISDQGAKLFLEGGAIPTRFPVLYDEGVLTDDDLGRVGDLGLTAARIARFEVPEPTQIQAAQDLVNERWGPDVRGEDA